MSFKHLQTALSLLDNLPETDCPSSDTVEVTKEIAKKIIAWQNEHVLNAKQINIADFAETAKTTLALTDAETQTLTTTLLHKVDKSISITPKATKKLQTFLSSECFSAIKSSIIEYRGRYYCLITNHLLNDLKKLNFTNAHIAKIYQTCALLSTIEDYDAVAEMIKIHIFEDLYPESNVNTSPITEQDITDEKNKFATDDIGKLNEYMIQTKLTEYSQRLLATIDSENQQRMLPIVYRLVNVAYEKANDDQKQALIHNCDSFNYPTHYFPSFLNNVCPELSSIWQKINIIAKSQRLIPIIDFTQQYKESSMYMDNVLALLTMTIKPQSFAKHPILPLYMALDTSINRLQDEIKRLENLKQKTNSRIDSNIIIKKIEAQQKYHDQLFLERLKTAAFITVGNRSLDENKSFVNRFEKNWGEYKYQAKTEAVLQHRNTFLYAIDTIISNACELILKAIKSPVTLTKKASSFFCKSKKQKQQNTNKPMQIIPTQASDAQSRVVEKVNNGLFWTKAKVSSKRRELPTENSRLLIPGQR